MSNLLFYTDDNIIGQSIQQYIIDNEKKITTLNYRPIVKGEDIFLADLVIINIIHKDISAGSTVALLNNIQKFLIHYTQLVLVIKSEISNLFRELLDFDDVVVLTEKSDLSDFSAIINGVSNYYDYQRLCSRRKLTSRELQVLRLIISCNDNKRIAMFLNITNKTVYSHISNIIKKLDMNNSLDMNKRINEMFYC